MKCLKCGTEFSGFEVFMIEEDGAEPICDLCAIKEEK